MYVNLLSFVHPTLVTSRSHRFGILQLLPIRGSLIAKGKMGSRRSAKCSLSNRSNTCGTDDQLLGHHGTDMLSQGHTPVGKIEELERVSPPERYTCFSMLAKSPTHIVHSALPITALVSGSTARPETSSRNTPNHRVSHVEKIN